MGFLIARLGHEVAVVRRDEDPSAVAASFSAAVVVLDGSDSLAETTDAAAAIERLVPSAKVIVVTDAATAGDHHFRVMPKWGLFDQLGLEIEVAAASATDSIPAHPR
ncbi:MAG TPA: hypothetical protein VJ375_06650 [Gaiellaceae bacterium]|jgi:hypothetical protein|nr:hypothetical protein [Gaiellaceae bacterium]